MYAIIRTGGKQYRVAAGDVVRVEKLDVELGKSIEITDVLLISGDKTYVGKPTVAKAKVTAVVTQQFKDTKVLVFKKKRRKGYKKTRGHRQLITELFIQAITSPDGQSVTAESKPHVIDPATQAARKEKRAAAAKEVKAEGSVKTTRKAATKKVSKKKVATKKKVSKKKTSKKK